MQLGGDSLSTVCEMNFLTNIEIALIIRTTHCTTVLLGLPTVLIAIFEKKGCEGLRARGRSVQAQI